MLTPFWAHSLFRRVFFHGLLVLLASVAIFVAFGELMVRPALDRQLLKFGHWLAPHVCAQLDQGEGHPERGTGVVATGYSADGRLIRSFVTPPLPPLSAPEVAQLRAEKATTPRHSRVVHAFWCENTKKDTYVVFGAPKPPPMQALLITLSIVVLSVALASIPFARSISRPLAKLVRVTQDFGRGELGTRIEMTRVDEVGELARAFNQMAERLQRVIVAEQELLANVSHELRTPLARIRVVLETALENPRRAEGLLREIDRDLGDLEQLVGTVMETVRLDVAVNSGARSLLPAQLESTDLADAARDAVSRFCAMYPDRQITLDLERDELRAIADVRLLRRLLDNLLDNARKYSDASASILLRAGYDEREAERLRLEVIDRGIGIDSVDLPHLFEPFFRGGGRDRPRGAQGAGLGLTLAKRIVDAHRGQIAISSEPGAGTIVRITLIRSGTGALTADEMH